jgi:ribonuclease PH
MRSDGRAPDQLRPLTIELSPIQYAEGSALIRMGNTQVLCAVSVEPQVPLWMRGTARGWLTAEYALLPRATLSRTPRSHIQGGRAQEIRRLIGRSLRRAVRLDLLGEITLTIDCDVIQADGGTRTAAVNGSYVAVALAVQTLIAAGTVPPEALMPPVGAVSVGAAGEELLLDLAYAEDAHVDMDLNVVMDTRGDFIEVQGTAEGQPIPRERLERLLDLASRGVAEIIAVQREVLACAGIRV